MSRLCHAYVTVERDNIVTTGVRFLSASCPLDVRPRIESRRRHRPASTPPNRPNPSRTLQTRFSPERVRFWSRSCHVFVTLDADRSVTTEQNRREQKGEVRWEENILYIYRG
jgi:hypothetical protein